MQRDSVANTFTVAICLCVVCSVLVSTAAIVLKPAQERNRLQDRKRNILQAAGLYTRDKPLDELFRQIETKIVDLQTGEYVDTAEVDPATYDQRAAMRDSMMSMEIPGAADGFGFARREKYSFVYLVNEDGRLSQIVLPVYGKGLWSTLFGFVALDADLKTIRGITFYEHGETPGLGGEVDNPNWKANWQGKQAFDDQGKPAIHVIKGDVDESRPDAEHQVDGLAGATITARGVSNMMQFWLGESGYKPFLEKLAQRPDTGTITATQTRPQNSTQ
jgi:Na+-transporting NADH:ubiquinone oxidoreductase subunit C